MYQRMKRIFASYVILPLIGVLFIAELAITVKGIAAEVADAITIPLSSLIREDRIIPNVNPNGITSLATSPDGSVIATGTHSNVLLWDYATGNHIKTLTDQSFWVYSLAFSPDGKILAVGSNRTIKLYSTTRWNVLKTIEGHHDAIKSIAFSPDGRTLASGGWSDDTIILWNVNSGEKIKTLVGHSTGSDVRSVAFSPDGKTLASGGRDHNLIIWDIASTNKTKIPYYDADEGEHSVAFSPNGAILAAGSEKEGVILRDTTTWKVITTFKNQLGRIKSLSFSPDGKVLAAWIGNSLVFYDLVTMSEIKAFKYSHDSYSISFSPDGKYLAAGIDKAIVLIDTGAFFALSSSNFESIIKNIETEMDQEIKRLSTKDEFETTKEYEQKMKTAKIQEDRLRKQYEARIKEAKDKGKREIEEKKARHYSYSFEINLGKYDADRSGFDAEVFGNKVFIPVPREKAKDIVSSKKKVYMEAKLRYFDSERVEIVHAKLVDKISDVREISSTPTATDKGISQATTQPAAASVSNIPLDFVVKKVSKTKEEQKIITSFSFPSGVLTPEYKTMTPSTGSIFIKIDIEVINQSDAKVKIEGEKLIVRTIEGKPVSLMDFLVFDDGKQNGYWPIESVSKEIDAGMSFIFTGLLGTVEENEKGITIRYGEVGKTVNVELSKDEPGGALTTGFEPLKDTVDKNEASEVAEQKPGEEATEKEKKFIRNVKKGTKNPPKWSDDILWITSYPTSTEVYIKPAARESFEDKDLVGKTPIAIEIEPGNYVIKVNLNADKNYKTYPYEPDWSCNIQVTFSFEKDKTKISAFPREYEITKEEGKAATVVSIYKKMDSSLSDLNAFFTNKDAFSFDSDKLTEVLKSSKVKIPHSDIPKIIQNLRRLGALSWKVGKEYIAIGITGENNYGICTFEDYKPMDFKEIGKSLLSRQLSSVG